MKLLHQSNKFSIKDHTYLRPSFKDTYMFMKQLSMQVKLLIVMLTFNLSLSSEGEEIKSFSSFFISKVFFLSEGGVGFTSNASSTF